MRPADNRSAPSQGSHAAGSSVRTHGNLEFGAERVVGCYRLRAHAPQPPAHHLRQQPCDLPQFLDVVELRPRHADNANALRQQRVTTFRVARYPRCTRMPPVAIVFYGDLRFRPVKVAYAIPSIGHRLRSSSRIDTVVEQKPVKPESAQSVRKAQQYCQHRLPRRSRSVQNVTQSASGFLLSVYLRSVIQEGSKLYGGSKRGHATGSGCRLAVLGIRAAQFKPEPNELCQSDPSCHLHEYKFGRAHKKPLARIRERVVGKFSSNVSTCDRARARPCACIANQHA